MTNQLEEEKCNQEAQKDFFISHKERVVYKTGMLFLKANFYDLSWWFNLHLEDVNHEHHEGWDASELSQEKQDTGGWKSLQNQAKKIY